ncbi:head completion/stabilization protein [Photobacterium galatheae]|uniref:Head protein n=1 Tax=Photobacterium galatheae TaxID=1654360 RepID=A0A066RH18_9GAMM|nr:head completion/stabilization protein [Photobacterium galatheae]KDM89705.1 head protein [Photobacterium galatheae]MCM0151543.1 head completion/stabilization protein [Photobacterium galatheae]
MSFGGRQNTDINTPVSGNGWPDLSTEEFRKVRRIPSVFDELSIVMALEAAALYVQGQLSDLLEGGEPPELSAPSVYRRAVYSRAHADLLPEFATQDRREVAENAAEDAPEQDARFRAQSTRDICLLLGRSPNGVELI